MPASESLQARYANSYALIVGINNYRHCSPLGYAVSDANGLASVLESRLGFPSKNIHLLLNEAATRTAILKQFLMFAGGFTEVNDRIVIFFAGHGYTTRSRRNDVGFLVPVDGKVSELDTLIRWDELTRSADLVNAKHVLFLMDACYGGLAITRALQPGSMRFLKDMLLRPARQVITAGKANEVVSDLGGPLADHSVFTGHLLEGLQGKAANSDGIVTANGVMAYVYQNVGRDPESQQTPHFGYVDGDGDLIFSAPELDKLLEDEKRDEDVLVSVPAVLIENSSANDMTPESQIKELLSDERYRIRLHDLVAREVRTALSLTSDDHFPVSGAWAIQDFAKRLGQYEDACANLMMFQSLLGYWGSDSVLETFVLAPKRMSGRIRPVGGLSMWINLRWYPLLLLLYAGGISSVAGGRYKNLSALLNAGVVDTEQSRGSTSLVLAVWGAVSRTTDAFKSLPGHERQYAATSEYMFKLLQPKLDDLLFLGSDYEASFDRFEILMGLEHAHQSTDQDTSRVWGPIGRFGWKFRRGYASPFQSLVAEAESTGSAWPPIVAGLFGGSLERFKKIAGEFGSLLSRLAWI